MTKSAFTRLIEAQIAGGVDGIVPVGTTGESATLSMEEHLRVIELTVQVVNRRVKVFAGTGSNSTAEAIYLTQEAKKLGADGFLIVSPTTTSRRRPASSRIIRRWPRRRGCPIIAYSVPGRTGIEIGVDTMASLALKHPNIVAIKEAGGSIERFSQLRQALPDNVAILSGDDSMTLPALAVGATGVISVASNLIPKQVGDMVRAFLAGRAEEAEQLHRSYYPLFRDLFIEANPVPVKTALARQGWMTEEVRLPLVPLQPQNRGRLEVTLEAVRPLIHEHEDRIIIVGSKGRMGEALVRLAARTRSSNWSQASTRATTCSTCIDRGNALIEFAHHSLSRRRLPRLAAGRGKALVIGTTGHTDEERAAIAAAANKIPVVFAPNFSVGVNLLFYLTQIAAETLGEDYDQEIVEMHHRQKLDAPSGTARRLGEILAEAAGGTYEELTQHGRHGDVGARPKRVIGMHALRGGDVVGDHTVHFSTVGERIELTHRASSRDTFASGALRAAFGPAPKSRVSTRCRTCSGCGSHTYFLTRWRMTTSFFSQ